MKTEEERREYARKAANLHRLRYPEKVAARKRAYALANAEAVAAYQREYREKNRERASLYNKEWRKANPRPANPEKWREQSRKWRERNPGASSVREGRRRAILLGAPGRGISNEQRAEILSLAAGLCAYCGHRKPLTLDHIEPLKKGGAHDVDNAVAVCRKCNSSKRTKSLLVFLVDRIPKASEARLYDRTDGLVATFTGRAK